MFGIDGTELLLIAVFAFIIFGPDKMPEIARTISKAVNQFKRTQEDMERLLKAEMNRAIEEEPVSTEETAKEPTVASSLYAESEQEDEE